LSLAENVQNSSLADEPCVTLEVFTSKISVEFSLFSHDYAANTYSLLFDFLFDLGHYIQGYPRSQSVMLVRAIVTV